MNIYAKKEKKKHKHADGEKKEKKDKLPHLADFLSNRDYTGAVTLLEFKRHVGKVDDVSFL